MTDISESAPDIGAARVLIVEDDTDYAEWIELALRGVGVRQIDKALNGAGALAATLSGPEYNLIICDWVMPKMDGLEFLKRYREKVATSMFLILTTKSALEDVLEATQAGATHYIVKPVAIEELQEEVVRMLRYS